MASKPRRYKTGAQALSPPVSEPAAMEGKRRRTKTSRFEFDFLDNEEQRMIQQAMKISRLETKRAHVEIEEAPTFYPTAEEFVDALAYVRKIQGEAEKYGICKIVPPAGWKPPSLISMDHSKPFITKLQNIHTLQEGQGFDDGNNYTMQSYKDMADKFYRDWVKTHHQGKEVSLEDLCKDYWDMAETNSMQASVEYGNDLNTTKYCSGFPSNKLNKPINSIKNMDNPDFYTTSSWNLNNIAAAPGSLLQYLKTPINGINVPWLYVGMLFASFCWHTEDNYFYSVNYSHFGSVKQWYGVPGKYADAFEKVSKDFLLGLFRESPDILHHMTTQISPSLLASNGVPVYKTSHEPGTFVITFPRSYHGGFSYGFNVGEAVNFATLDWIGIGGEAEERYRRFARESVFSHQRLLFTLWQNVNDLRSGGCQRLAQEIVRILDEEIASRTAIVRQGIRDLSKEVPLAPNDFSVIDPKAADYDDMRICCICRQTCVFTAVACECDKNRVSCIRHYNFMCKCAKEKKFMLVWAQTPSLKTMLNEASRFQHSS